MTVFEGLYRAGATTVAVLVVIQAMMAGQFLFGAGGIATHGTLGNIAFGIAALTTVVAYLARRAWLEPLVGAVVTMALTAQLGLGYSGRSALGAREWHIPLGVIVFGLVTYQLILAWPMLVPSGRRSKNSSTTEETLT